MPHHPLPAHALPRFLGYLLGLITATDFIASLSILVASEYVRSGLQASPAQFVWILTAYAAAGMAVIPLIERLARRWHYRSLLVAALLLFVVGALWAAASDSVASAIAARALQGLGGGGLFTMSRVYLQLAVPTAARPQYVRHYLLAMMGGTAPIAWLTTSLVVTWGWRTVFLLDAAVGASVAVLTLLHLKAERHTPQSLGKLDWPMTLSFALAMLLLLHGMEDLQLHALDGIHAALFALALAALAFAAWRLHRDHDPLLDIRVLNGRRFLVGLGFYALYYLINGATSFIYPKLFEQGIGLGFTTIGALLSLAAATSCLLLPVYFACAPRLGDRRRVIASGFAIAAIALAWMAWQITVDTSFLALLLPMALKGIFPVLCVVQIAGLTYRDVAHEDFIHAYALKNVARQLAYVFAAGLTSHYWQHLEAHYRATTSRPLASAATDPAMVISVGNHLLLAVAALCLLGIPLILWQKRLH